MEIAFHKHGTAVSDATVRKIRKMVAGAGARFPRVIDATVLFSAEGVTRLFVLPLYPQYSKTTTGSSINEWERRFQPNGWNPRVHVVREFYEDAGYLDAVVEGINESLGDFEDRANVDIVFSAHSVPVAVIDKGDPYQRQIEHTVDLVWQRGGWPARR